MGSLSKSKQLLQKSLTSRAIYFVLMFSFKRKKNGFGPWGAQLQGLQNTADVQKLLRMLQGLRRRFIDHGLEGRTSVDEGGY